jgi:hypothetical protein
MRHPTLLSIDLCTSSFTIRGDRINGRLKKSTDFLCSSNEGATLGIARQFGDEFLVVKEGVIGV